MFWCQQPKFAFSANRPEISGKFYCLGHILAVSNIWIRKRVDRKLRELEDSQQRNSQRTGTVQLQCIGAGRAGSQPLRLRTCLWPSAHKKRREGYLPAENPVTGKFHSQMIPCSVPALIRLRDRVIPANETHTGVESGSPRFERQYSLFFSLFAGSLAENSSRETASTASNYRIPQRDTSALPAALDAEFCTYRIFHLRLN